MSLKRKLQLPFADGIGSVETMQSVVIVGANGSGKTRLGVWIEMRSPDKSKVHRISAQKSLSMPDSTTPEAMDIAEKKLLFGHPLNESKTAFKWQNKPATCMLNDFDKLLVYLFSEETEVNARFKIEYRDKNELIPIPYTKLDYLKKIWENVLPHRKLLIGGLKIQTVVTEHNEMIYNASDMSDGERVIFYLIGQCLAAPRDGIIVIDEPELHIHKSVQNALWREIESIRSDCMFVYLTHDIDFAVSQGLASCVWLKSYDGSSWDFERIMPDDNLPDDLLLEVLGNRKPVVFVEGEAGSHDVSLCRALLPDYLVVPRGSCSQVISSVKAFKANAQLHHLQVCGIVDRDRRVDAEISSLESDSVFVLTVAEVENLFCTPGVLEIVSRRLARDPDADFKDVSDHIFKRLRGEFEKQVSLHTASEIQFQLNKFDQSKCGIQLLSDEFDALIGGINLNNIFKEWSEKFSEIMRLNDYAEMLKVYNRKSLVRQVSGCLGLQNDELPELVVRLAYDECHDEIRDVLRPYFGGFAQHMESVVD